MDKGGVSGDVLFVLLGAILVFAMHGGFAFLEVGTVRRKNQVNALVKILTDFALSVTAYFFIGYSIAYGVSFLVDAKTLVGGADGFDKQGFALVKFFFLATFAAAIPAIISGGIAERMKFFPQCAATVALVALVYPFFEGQIWNADSALQSWFKASYNENFHDFAGSIVVHAVGGWIAFSAVILLGARKGRYDDKGRSQGIPPSSIPWLALGSWLLCIGWFGFNVMSAQSLAGVSGLVAMNSLMAMCGGILTALFVGKNDPGFIHNGALAGLVAVCAGSDIMHPVGSFVVGGIAGVIFVVMFQICQEKLRVDDVLGVWPLHGLCGLWGGIAAGIFGLSELGGLGGVSLTVQIIGSLVAVVYATAMGALVYGVLKFVTGLRMTDDEERMGADLAIHKISASPEEDMIR